MENRFDQYFERNRTGFDLEQPDDDRLWRAIASKLERPAMTRRVLLQVAAVALLIVTVGVTVRVILRRDTQTEEKGMYSTGLAASGPESRIFTLAIEEKMKQVEASGIEPHAYMTMAGQLREIDRDLATYYSDLEIFGNQPRIIRGIIRCYEMKIKILERTLSESEKKQNHENRKNLL